MAAVPPDAGCRWSTCMTALASGAARRKPLPEHGRNPYADGRRRLVEHSPYASPTLKDDFNAEIHNAGDPGGAGVDA